MWVRKGWLQLLAVSILLAGSLAGCAGGGSGSGGEEEQRLRRTNL